MGVIAGVSETRLAKRRPVHKSLVVFGSKRNTARQAAGRCIEKPINLFFQKDLLKLFQ